MCADPYIKGTHTLVLTRGINIFLVSVYTVEHVLKVELIKNKQLYGHKQLSPCPKLIS